MALTIVKINDVYMLKYEKKDNVYLGKIEEVESNYFTTNGFIEYVRDNLASFVFVEVRHRKSVWAQYGLIKIQMKLQDKQESVLEKRITELESVIRFIADNGLGDSVVNIIRKKYPSRMDYVSLEDSSLDQ
jgi:hypothetical protein